MGRPLSLTNSVAITSTYTNGASKFNYPWSYEAYVGSCNRGSTGSRQYREQFEFTNGYPPQRAYQFSCDTVVHVQSSSVKTPLPTGNVQTISDTFYVRDAMQMTARSTAWTDPWMDTTQALALTDLNKRVRDQTTGLGELVAEGRKTGDMLLKMARRVIKGYLAVKGLAKATTPKAFDANLRKLGESFGISTKLKDQPASVQKRRKQLRRGLTGGRASKDVANLWLEYRYGWLPLYKTAYGAMVAYDKIVRRKHIRHVYGRAENTATPSSGYHGAEYGLYNAVGKDRFGASNVTAWMSWKLPWTQSEKLRVQVGYYLELTNAHLATNSTLGLSDPITLAWELLPLSFVVDWFVNAGDVLQQLSNFNGWTFRAGYRTVTQTCTKVITVQPWYMPNNASQKVTCVPGKLTRTKYLYRRDLLTGVQYFGLRLHNGLNLTRLFDALALGRQSVR